MGENQSIYFQDGEIVAQYGTATVYKMNKELFLEIGPGHNLWALETELTDYMQQLDSFPKGDVLEIGLGLGVASRYLLTFPDVDSVTTIELNEDVIKAHELIKDIDRSVLVPKLDKPHNILNADGLSYAYMTKKRYDFVFVDCYDRIDEETLPVIADMIMACSNILKVNGGLIAWLDKYTPEPYYSAFQQLLAQY